MKSRGVGSGGGFSVAQRSRAPSSRVPSSPCRVLHVPLSLSLSKRDHLNIQRKADQSSTSTCLKYGEAEVTEDRKKKMNSTIVSKNWLPESRKEGMKVKGINIEEKAW